MAKCNKKSEIREKAIALFKARGFDNVTINDICKNSNISKNTFYYHFVSKNEILKKLSEEGYDFTGDKLRTLLKTKSPYKRFISLFEFKINFIIDSGKEITRKIYIKKIHENVGKHTKTFFPIACDFIKEAQDSNEILNKSKPETLVQASICLLIGSIETWLLKENFDLSKEFIKLLDALLIKL